MRIEGRNIMVDIVSINDVVIRINAVFKCKGVEMINKWVFSIINGK